MSDARTLSKSHDMSPQQLESAKKALRQAMNMLLDGNLSELARRCGVTPQAAMVWLRSGLVPPMRVRKVCDALEDLVEDWELRPDIFRSPE